MTTQHDAVLTAASAALAPSLRRGKRGRRVDRTRVGLDEGPLDRDLQAAARERGLALFACTSSARKVNVVSLAGPTERELRLEMALKMLKTRPRSAACSFCSLQDIVPAKGKSPLVPVAGTFHRLHPECSPGWKLWAAAAEKHLAARRPSPIPATAGLAAAVIRIAPKLLGNGRGWRGSTNELWCKARATGGRGAWVGDGFGSASFANVLHADAEVSGELAEAGLLAWLGGDGLMRLARIAEAPASNRTRANQCGLCEIVENDLGETLEQLRGGARSHGRCEFARVVAQHSRRRAA